MLHFRAKSFSATNWNGVATGVVQVSTPQADILLFHESGYFRQNDGQETRFSNVFRWTKIGDRLRLEHLRFGEKCPVFLFDMTQETDGVWREVLPHPCRKDCYRATLPAENKIVFMRWRVEGEARDEIIDYTYL